jgi:hypothetical protein
MHMLSQEKLLKVIDAALIQSKNAAQRIEHMTLLQYLQMAQEAGDDQAKLEAVVSSLEKNHVIGRYQQWRELSQT